MGNSPFYRFKNHLERQRGELWRQKFLFFFLNNIFTHFQVLSVTFIEYGQNVNIHDISQIKIFGGEMGGAYIT